MEICIENINEEKFFLHALIGISGLLEFILFIQRLQSLKKASND